MKILKRRLKTSNNGQSVYEHSSQNEELPNITGQIKYASGAANNVCTADGLSIVSGGWASGWCGDGTMHGGTSQVTVTLNAGQSNPIYFGEHVIPYNSAIQLWKRIA